MGRESNAALIRRHETVKGHMVKAEKSLARTERQSVRDDRSRWIGLLRFTLLSIESEMSDRGILQ